MTPRLEGALDLAMASDDVQGVWAAIERLPAGKSSMRPASHGARAWLAARRHDVLLERAELMAVLEGRRPATPGPSSGSPCSCFRPGADRAAEANPAS